MHGSRDLATPPRAAALTSVTVMSACRSPGGRSDIW